jgi:hypothetical protein
MDAIPILSTAMENTALAPLVEQITQRLTTLSEAELRTIQDFVDYLAWKHHGDRAQPLAQRSAEARALERLPDLDNPNQWITVVEEGEDVDEEALTHWLKIRGYQD